MSVGVKVDVCCSCVKKDLRVFCLVMSLMIIDLLDESELRFSFLWWLCGLNLLIFLMVVFLGRLKD